VQTAAVRAGPDEPVSLSSDDAISVANFAEHSLRKLCLPPVAEASIRFLVFYHLDHCENDATSTIKKLPPLRTLCAALTYFVCRAGSTVVRKIDKRTESIVKFHNRLWARKKQGETRQSGHRLTSETCRRSARFQSDNEDAADTNQPLLDLFADSSTSAAFSLPSSVLLAEQREYEMLRMWDAWGQSKCHGRGPCRWWNNLQMFLDAYSGTTTNESCFPTEKCCWKRCARLAAS
jgi:hypothetical protein